MRRTCSSSSASVSRPSFTQRLISKKVWLRSSLSNFSSTRSAPAFSAIALATGTPHRRTMAPMPIASVVMTPWKPSSSRSSSVMMRRETVAGITSGSRAG